MIVRPVHCELHAAPAIEVTAGVPTQEAVRALMDEAWGAVTELWLATGGSPEPGRRERPPLRERVTARLVRR
jgi:hypothetical protein